MIRVEGTVFPLGFVKNEIFRDVFDQEMTEKSVSAKSVVSSMHKL